MNISTAAITAAAATGTPVLHVVVQDASGASTAATIDLSVAASGVEGALATSSDGGAALQACLDTQAQWNAACAPGEGIALSLFNGGGTGSVRWTADEVQTPLRVPAKIDVPLGSPVFFRHAKTGELSEHFNEYVLVRGERIEGRATPYRGAGKTFL